MPLDLSKLGVLGMGWNAKDVPTRSNNSESNDRVGFILLDQVELLY